MSEIAPAAPPSLPRWRRVGLPVLGIFFTQSAVHSTRPAVALAAHRLGASPALIGALAALYPLIPIFLALPAGRFTDQRGGRAMGALGSLVLALGLTAFALLPRLAGLAAAQVLAGAGFLVAAIGYQTATAHGGTPRALAGDFAWLTVAISVAQLLGQPGGGWLFDHFGPVAPFWGGAVAGTLAAALALLPGWPRRPRPATGGGTPLRDTLGLLRNRPLLVIMVCGGLVLLAEDAMATFFPLYADGIGLSATAIGLVLAVRAACQLLVRPFLELVARRLGEHRVLLLSLCLGGLSLALFGLVAGLGPLLALAVVGGAAFGLAPPLTLSGVAATAPPDRRGLAISLRLAVSRVIQTVSPLLAGAAAAAAGAAAALWLVGGLLALWSAAGHRFAKEARP